MVTRMTIDPITFKNVTRSELRAENKAIGNGWDNSPILPLPGLRCPSCSTESLVKGRVRSGSKKVEYICLLPSCHRATVNPLTALDK